MRILFYLLIICLIVLLSSCTLKYNSFSCSPDTDGNGSCVVNFKLVEHDVDYKPKLKGQK